MPKATPLFLQGLLWGLRLLRGFPSACASGLADQSRFPARADLNTDGQQFTPVSPQYVNPNQDSPATSSLTVARSGGFQADKT